MMSIKTIISLLLGLLVITLLPAGATQAQDARLVWSRIAGVPSEVTLEDVFLVGTDAAWAVGRDQAGTAGYAYELALIDGRWQVRRAGVFAQALYAIAATDMQSAWAVGANGYIVRRGPGGWQQVESPIANATLRTIQLLGDGREGWAMGYVEGRGGRVPASLRYTGGRWQAARIDSTSVSTYVEAVHLNNGGGWAVGSHLWRLSDGAWRLEATPDLCGGGVSCAVGFTGVRAIDAEQAWAVGSRSGICGICTPKSAVVVRDRSGWRDAFPKGYPDTVIPPAPALPDTHGLGAVVFSDAASGLAVGTRTSNRADGQPTAEIFGLRYRGGTWRHELILDRSGLAVTGLSMADPTRALLVGEQGLLLSYGYGDQPGAGLPPGQNPAAPVPNPNLPGVVYFPETGHSLRGAFLSTWQRYGGLAQFGYPLTEEFVEVSETDGNAYIVQYFERARFEYHPEHAGTPYEVLLGLLGRSVTRERTHEQPFQGALPGAWPGGIYIPETSHNMAPEFVDYWQRNGGLAIYGYPISEPFYEVNAADGRSYLVQYFERNRFEYHPEHAGTPYEVLLGLLGSEVLRMKGWR